MVTIIPAVLPKSFDDLKEKLGKIAAVAPEVQIDAVDGEFAHGKTWPFKDAETFQHIVAEEHGLPYWEKLDFQFDLMMQHAEAKVSDFVHAGASRIIVHATSEGAADAVQKLVDLREESGAFTVQVGVAIMADVQPEILEVFEAQFDFIQVMGIAHIGKQGEPLEQKAVFLIERLRHRYPELPLQVDGGVTLENAASLVKAGATSLVAGSAIFKADDPVAAYQALLAKANEQHI